MSCHQPFPLSAQTTTPCKMAPHSCTRPRERPAADALSKGLLQASLQELEASQSEVHDSQTHKCAKASKLPAYFPCQQQGVQLLHAPLLPLHSQAMSLNSYPSCNWQHPTNPCPRRWPAISDWQSTIQGAHPMYGHCGFVLMSASMACLQVDRNVCQRQLPQPPCQRTNP
jgi:hypothetical protein